MTKRQQNTDSSRFNFKTALQIRFADMDAFNHVNNAIYLTYMEIARTSYWEKVVHWDWNEMGVIIARAEVDYLIPLTVYHQLEVHVKTTRVGNSSFDLEYLLTTTGNDKQQVHATGKTACVCFDYKANKTTTIPEKYKAIMLQDID